LYVGLFASRTNLVYYCQQNHSLFGRNNCEKNKWGRGLSQRKGNKKAYFALALNPELEHYSKHYGQTGFKSICGKMIGKKPMNRIPFDSDEKQTKDFKPKSKSVLVTSHNSSSSTHHEERKWMTEVTSMS